MLKLQPQIIITILIFSGLLLVGSSTIAFGKVLFSDNFESDSIDSPPSKWAVGHKGALNDAKVIKDPIRPNNLVFSSPTERHDTTGSIYVTGKGKDWTDYYVQWEMLFPKAFYMGIVFRFSGGESFYLLDRRENTKKLDFWKREKNWKNFGSSEKRDLAPNKWFALQLEAKGSKFEVKIKEAKDKTEFKQLDPALSGSNEVFKKGDFGNYGHVLLDNVVIATSVDELSTPVELNGNFVTNWGSVKSGYTF